MFTSFNRELTNRIKTAEAERVDLFKRRPHLNGLLERLQNHRLNRVENRSDRLRQTSILRHSGNHRTDMVPLIVEGNGDMAQVDHHTTLEIAGKGTLSHLGVLRPTRATGLRLRDTILPGLLAGTHAWVRIILLTIKNVVVIARNQDLTLTGPETKECIVPHGNTKGALAENQEVLLGVVATLLRSARVLTTFTLRMKLEGQLRLVERHHLHEDRPAHSVPRLHRHNSRVC